MALIATSTINIPCFRIIGIALPQMMRVHTFGIPGVNGTGVHLLGNYGEPATWTVKQFGSVVGLQDWFDLIAASKGVVCALQNDEGLTYPNQLIEGVTQPTTKTAFDLSGSEEIWTVKITTRTV